MKKQYRKLFYSNSTKKMYKIRAEILRIWIWAKDFVYIFKVGLL